VQLLKLLKTSDPTKVPAALYQMYVEMARYMHVIKQYDKSSQNSLKHLQECLMLRQKKYEKEARTRHLIREAHAHELSDDPSDEPGDEPDDDHTSEAKTINSVTSPRPPQQPPLALPQRERQRERQRVNSLPVWGTAVSLATASAWYRVDATESCDIEEERRLRRFERARRRRQRRHVAGTT